jgi:GNAT superfamily N-acetyltransferase
MKISPMQTNQIDAVVKMGRAFTAAAGLDKLGAFDEAATRKFLEDASKSDKATVLVAESDDKAVGMLGLMMMPLYFSPSTTFATEMFWWVEPEHRKSGTGKALLDAAEKWAKERGATVCTMISLSQSEPDRVPALYRSAGYEPLETTWMRRL